MNKLEKIPTETTYEVGTVIKKVRKEKNISIEKLAVLTKFSEQTLYSIESGRRVPKFDTIKTICEVLEYPIILMIMKSIKGDEITEIYTKIIESFNDNRLIENATKEIMTKETNLI